MSRRRWGGIDVVETTSAPPDTVVALHSEHVEAFIERLELPDGPLELEPWQRAIFDGMLEDVAPAELALRSRRWGRRQAMARAIAVSVLLGEDVAVCSTSERGAQELREAALAELVAIARVFGLELGPTKSEHGR